MHVLLNISKGVLALVTVLLLAQPAISEELSLQQAINTAVNNNPSIAAGQLSAQAASQAAKGARAFVNPELFVAPSVIGDAGADSAVFFSQPLELNGSRTVRSKIATQEANAAAYDAATLQRNIVLNVKQAYWETARAQELVKLNQENVQYIETLKAAVQKQFDAGAVPGSQVMKTDVELAKAKQELAQAQLDLNQSKAALNTLTNQPQNRDYTVTEPLTFNTPIINREQLLTTAKAQRPEVTAAQARASAAWQRIRAAKLLKVPDLAIQARKESFSNESDGGVAIAITLPLIDWGSAKAERRRAESAALSDAKQLEAEQNNAALDVERAIQQVCTSSEILKQYQSGILDKSEQLAEMARKGYEKGATSYLEVLEAQRTLRSTRAEYYSALANYAEALAQLEWASGCDLRNATNQEGRK